VGFEPTIPVFELAKTVHVLDRAATVIGIKIGSGIQKLIGGIHIQTRRYTDSKVIP
jgi:hypothetical protein